MRKRFFRGVAAAIVLFFAQVTGAAPPSDPSTWESSVVTTGKVMFVSGDLKINDFSAVLDNGLVGVFVPSITNRPVGVYRFGAGTDNYSLLAVYGSTGGSGNGALPNEALSFWFHDNTTGLTTLALAPNGTVTYQGASPSYTYPSAVPLRVYYPPTITAFDNNGAVGAQVAIAGTNFCAVSGNDNVTFTGGVRATVDNVVNGMNLVVTVPAGAQSGPIRITTPGGSFLTSGSFAVPPKITGFSPGSGGQSASVTISGYNFGSTPAVAFAGASATVVSASDNEVVATVPADAITGTITVTTSVGTADSSASFSVQPTVVGFTPTSGRVGDNVTITGYNFDDSSASATSVSFNGVAADIVPGTLTRTSLVASVPVGADNGAITVTTVGGQAISAWIFTVVVLPPNHFPAPVPSGFVTTAGGTIKKNGVPASMGDEVAAWSVHRKPGQTTKFEKTLIGRAMLTTPGGVLSGMEIYGDNTATTGAVEGAGQGEEICFVLWSDSEQRAYYAYKNGTTGDPVSVTWDNAAGSATVDLDFVPGNRYPLRNGAWNLFSHGVLAGYYKGSIPTKPQLSGVIWDNVALSMANAFPFKSLGSKLDRVVGNDGSGNKVYLAGVGGTMTWFAPGYGYWVKMKTAADNQVLSWMTVPGPLSAGTEALTFGADNTVWTLGGYWGNAVTYNLSGYDPSGELLPVSASDNVVVSPMGQVWTSIAGSYDRVVTSDVTGNHLYLPGLPSQIKYLGPGYGYWIKMKNSAGLTYPAGTR
ncbi:MAG: hypothetical protein B7Z62_04530 [Deltaproteobacteria bacterium 37-65-8]|nr:MAG: hypothetical protein B7Z62_04530 [Deltaproteobacteria bacterium 37-65-8]HQT97074.1 hypothetical protein [Thermodesulfobacteriota bacterium]